MNNKHTHYNRKILAGCGLFLVLSLLALILAAVLLLKNDRAAACYPNFHPIV